MIHFDTIHLLEGSHRSSEDGGCVMEWVSYLAGEPWSDHPECVSEVIGAFMRSWNDSLPDEDRDRLLKPLVSDVIGTRTTPDDETTRAWLAIDWFVRVHTPAWLRLAGLNDQADQIANLAPLDPETCPKIQPVLNAVRKDAAWDAARAWDAGWDAARDAAWAAAWAAARAAAGAAAWDAARDAAWDAARDAAWAAARAAAWDAARAALRPTVIELQASAQELVRAMCAVGRES